MGSLEDRQAANEVRQRKALQQEIQWKFGIKVVNARRKKLCDKCQAVDCQLLPITTEGYDCPYFAPRASLSE